MTRQRAKAKGRSEHGTYVQLPHAVLNAPKYRQLSSIAVKLLFDLYVQYRGSNNGDFSLPWSTMKERNWRSKATLSKACKELLSAGFIELTRQGGKHRCNLYAVTWLAVDECKGKLDVPPTRTAAGIWKSSATANGAA